MKSEAVMSGVRKPCEVPPPCWRYRVLTWTHCVMKATQVNYVQSLMREPDSQWNELSIRKSHNRSLTRVEFQFLVITAEYPLFGILPLIPLLSFLSSLPFSSFLPPSILSSLILLSLKYVCGWWGGKWEVYAFLPAQSQAEEMFCGMYEACGNVCTVPMGCE